MAGFVLTENELVKRTYARLYEVFSKPLAPADYSTSTKPDYVIPENPKIVHGLTGRRIAKKMAS